MVLAHRLQRRAKAFESEDEGVSLRSHINNRAGIECGANNVHRLFRQYAERGLAACSCDLEMWLKSGACLTEQASGPPPAVERTAAAASLCLARLCDLQPQVCVPALFLFGGHRSRQDLEGRRHDKSKPLQAAGGNRRPVTRGSSTFQAELPRP